MDGRHVLVMMGGNTIADQPKLAQRLSELMTAATAMLPPWLRQMDTNCACCTGGSTRPSQRGRYRSRQAWREAAARRLLRLGALRSTARYDGRTMTRLQSREVEEESFSGDEEELVSRYRQDIGEEED